MTKTASEYEIPKQYIDAEGRISHWPRRKKRDEQMKILRYLVQFFDTGTTYTEREVNDILKAHHTFEDWAMLRRELFELGWLGREKNGTSYWRTNVSAEQ